MQSTEERDKMRDRAEGILTGLCAGDRNGGPVRMATRLAESLADCGMFDVRDVGSRYLHWWRNGAFDTGGTAAKVLERVDRGETFETAAVAVHEESGGKNAGCNPAHRCPPLAMAAWLPLDELPKAVQAEASLTHIHPESVDAAVAVAVLCRLLIIGVKWEEALERTADGRGEAVRHALRTRYGDPIRSGGYAPDVLGAAVSFLDGAAGFTGALERSLEFAGPANYCPVVAGALAGARWGRSSIPRWLLTDGSIVPRVESAAERLSRDWSASDPHDRISGIGTPCRPVSPNR
jgi:ADP-ribosylglycohydrolase